MKERDLFEIVIEKSLKTDKAKEKETFKKIMERIHEDERQTNLFKEILTKILEKQKVEVYVKLSPKDITDLLNNTCYKALNKIQEIIQNDNYDDFECIERIVCVFEEIGSNGGNRHDY